MHGTRSLLGLNCAHVVTKAACKVPCSFLPGVGERSEGCERGLWQQQQQINVALEHKTVRELRVRGVRMG